MLFKFSGILDGKRLEALHVFMAQSNVMEQQIMPVVNATARNGKLKETTPTGNVADVVFASIPSSHPMVNKDFLRTILEKNSLNAGSIDYVVQQLIKSKRLKKTKRNGVWEVRR